MAAKRSGDFRYLVQHNGHPTWHAVKDVPRKLQAALQKKRFIKSLGTHDIVEARSLRWAALEEFERELRAAQGHSGPMRAVTAGLAWRSTLARINSGDPAAIAVHTRYGDLWGPLNPHEPPRDPRAIANDNAATDIFTLAEEMPAAEARVFLDVAHGRATPLLHHVDSWLAEGGRKGPLQPRTASQYRADLNRLAKWTKAAGLPETLEAVTKAMVGRYVTEAMVKPKVDPLTANRWISAPSAYWRWLIKRGVAETNPWAGQSLAKRPARSREERPKRAYTDDEMRTLLAGSPSRELGDLLRVAALSGMRLEEIYRLTVADCAGGWFRVRVSKTEAGVRRVPIHSALVGIVAARCEAKKPGEFMFHEPENDRQRRSSAVSKRFRRYRKSLGVDDTKEGRRASAVDFHSLRRWFITKALEGFDKGAVAQLVGHEAGNITEDVYSAGPSDEKRKAIVESVKLPVSVGPA